MLVPGLSVGMAAPRSIGRRWRAAEGAMGASRIIVLTPFLDQDQCLSQTVEDLRIGAGQSEYGYRNYLIEALQVTGSRGDFGWVNPAWPAAALLFADHGLAQSVETNGLACQRHYIAVSQWFKDVASNHIFATAELLSQGVVEAARQRDRLGDP